MTTELPLPALTTASGPPAEEFDVALLDLDGVVYLGREPVPGAAAALAAARERGMRIAFVTNNASRTPDEVVTLLDEVGVKAEPAEVVTSAQAAARVLAERLPAGARVLVIGSAALRAEVVARGLVPVSEAEDDPQAVVCGFSPELGWRHLVEATVAVRRGAYWLATNLDITLPSPRGPGPGNGSLVGAVAAALGRRPDVAGKPDPALHRESVDRTGARRPIAVGDVLGTDIEGANRVGCASLLVLSGVTVPADVLIAAPKHRPTFIAADVGGLLNAQAAVDVTGSDYRCGRWRASWEGAGVTLRVGSGAPSTDARPVSDPDRLDALRAACVALWSATGIASPTSVDELGEVLSAGDEEAAAVLRDWGVPAGA
jgi:HAD superfamily hydrolase (TIGR01450 family)